jgi:hypothetical protein
VKAGRREVLRRIGVRLGWRFGVGFYGLTQEADAELVRRPPVRVAATVEEVAARLAGERQYTPDPLSGLVDIMRHPRHVQARLDAGTPIGDCDEFAAYWLACLLKSGLADRAYLGIYQGTRIGDGRPVGHALTLYDVDLPRPPTSNRDGAVGPLPEPADRPSVSERRWVDYRLPATYEGRWGWVEPVSESFGARPIFAGIARVERLTEQDTLVFGERSGKAFR